MQAINTKALEASVRFQRGAPLPPPENLIELLNELGKSREAGNLNESFRLENEIRKLVAPGVYQGYLGDDLSLSAVRVTGIERNDGGANAHTFYIAFDVLDGIRVIRSRKMELREFLLPVNRERPSGAHEVGPRFQPL